MNTQTQQQEVTNASISPDTIDTEVKNAKAKSFSSKLASIILYPDSAEYNFEDVIHKITLMSCEYAMAYHDQDVEADGTLKKPHWHVTIKKEASFEFEAIAKTLGIPSNHIEKSKSFRAGVRYLVHADQPDKYQYSPDIIKANFNYKKFFKEDSDAKGMMLYEAILSGQASTMFELYSIAKEANAWSEFRRNAYLYQQAINSMRNAVYKNMEKFPSQQVFNAVAEREAELKTQKTFAEVSDEEAQTMLF